MFPREQWGTCRHDHPTTGSGSPDRARAFRIGRQMSDSCRPGPVPDGFELKGVLWNYDIELGDEHFLILSQELKTAYAMLIAGGFVFDMW